MSTSIPVAIATLPTDVPAVAAATDHPVAVVILDHRPVDGRTTRTAFSLSLADARRIADDLTAVVQDLDDREDRDSALHHCDLPCCTEQPEDLVREPAPSALLGQVRDHMGVVHGVSVSSTSSSGQDLWTPCGLRLATGQATAFPVTCEACRRHELDALADDEEGL